jgi:alpha/beta hydrolase family protein
MKVLFLHGWQSVPGGVKSTYLARHGHEVINPKLPDEDFNEAVRIAQAEFDRRRPDVVVGSSRGGAVAMNMDSGEAPLARCKAPDASCELIARRLEKCGGPSARLWHS